MWKVLILDDFSGSGSLIVVVLLGGVGAVDEERASLTVDKGSPLVCSRTEAMPRAKMRGAGAAARCQSERHVEWSESGGRVGRER